MKKKVMNNMEYGKYNESKYKFADSHSIGNHRITMEDIDKARRDGDKLFLLKVEYDNIIRILEFGGKPRLAKKVEKIRDIRLRQIGLQSELRKVQDSATDRSEYFSSRSRMSDIKKQSKKMSRKYEKRCKRLVLFGKKRDLSTVMKCAIDKSVQDCSCLSHRFDARYCGDIVYIEDMSREDAKKVAKNFVRGLKKKRMKEYRIEESSHRTR